jgi:hypothetical protein
MTRKQVHASMRRASLKNSARGKSSKPVAGSLNPVRLSRRAEQQRDRNALAAFQHQQSRDKFYREQRHLAQRFAADGAALVPPDGDKAAQVLLLP